jgi:FkbM family methyltransferase
VSVRDQLQRVARRSGYIVQRWPPEGSLERELQRLIANRSVDLVLDVGAHVGLYGATLRRIGFGGRIVSFEPSPGPFARLAGSVTGHWDTHRLALGDATGTARLHLYDAHEEFTSLHQPSQLGREQWGLSAHSTIDVPLRRLDDVVDELSLDASRALIKIDTQGHDAAVLDGAPRTLSAAAALQIELPSSRLYEGAAPLEELLVRADQAGFALLGMFPVHAHPRPLIPVEFDGLFARRDDPPV